ncbi:MAG: FHA domain-containing protein [Oligoflexia bacterium]|nr:FHA domain-containing protein [Oligoflexia bacterium]
MRRRRKIEIKHEMILGRGQHCEICINDSDVSGKHLQFLIKEETLWLVDLASTNGTFVNGVKISAQTASRIRNGDRLHVGSVQFEVQIEECDLWASQKSNEKRFNEIPDHLSGISVGSCPAKSFEMERIAANVKRTQKDQEAAKEKFDQNVQRQAPLFYDPQMYKPTGMVGEEQEQEQEQKQEEQEQGEQDKEQDDCQESDAGDSMVTSTEVLPSIAVVQNSVIIEREQTASDLTVVSSQSIPVNRTDKSNDLQLLEKKIGELEAIKIRLEKELLEYGLLSKQKGELQKKMECLIAHVLTLEEVNIRKRKLQELNLQKEKIETRIARQEGKIAKHEEFRALESIYSELIIRINWIDEHHGKSQQIKEELIRLKNEYHQQKFKEEKSRIENEVKKKQEEKARMTELQREIERLQKELKKLG